MMIQRIQPKAPRFQGKEQEEQYFKVLSQVSDDTAKRLLIVSALQPQELHVRQSKAFATVDPVVEWVNREIGHLVRNKSQGPSQAIKTAAQETLNDLRKALGRFLKGLTFDQRTYDGLQKTIQSIQASDKAIDDLPKA